MKILAIGDCNTGGMRETPYENMPEEFKKILVSHGYDVELDNLGFGMHSTREGVSYADGYKGQADILLLNFGLVDSWLAVLPKWYVPYYPDYAWRKLARKLLKSLKKRLRNPFIRQFLPIGHAVPLDEYEVNYIRIIEKIRDRSPKVEVILWGTVPTYLSTERDKEIIVFNERVKKIAQQHQAHYIDTRDLFKPYSYEELYRDHVHMNSFGQKLIAEEIYKSIADKIAHHKVKESA